MYSLFSSGCRLHESMGSQSRQVQPGQGGVEKKNIFPALEIWRLISGLKDYPALITANPVCPSLWVELICDHPCLSVVKIAALGDSNLL
jgi:hypothetical protein